MVILRRIFMMDGIVFQINYTIPKPLYTNHPFWSSIMVFNVIYGVRWTSRNARCIIITTASHLVLIGYFYHVAYLIHVLRFSSRITDGPPALPVWNPPH